MTRRDIVPQAISRVMAVQTGIYHAVTDAKENSPCRNVTKQIDPNDNAEVEYSYPALLNEVTAISLENLAWSRVFEYHAIRPAELVSEDVVADEAYAHLDMMAMSQGLDHAVKKVPRRLARLSNHRHDDWRERFFDDASKAGFSLPC
ncbi:Stf0 sulfotransferase family protein [Cereibacter sphaeroides]|nr:Stf0 sulfotransferase family protein [Cereibacter sphaeroides]